MADRVPISITIGGRLSGAAYLEMAKLVIREGLSVEWDGPPFDPGHCDVGHPLSLYADEVAWGRAGSLEKFCADHGLPFVRWSGGYPGEWNPERIVFRGEGEPDSYIVDENDRVMVDRHIVADRGSVEAVLSYFAEADFEVPPLEVEDDPEPDAASEQRERSESHG